MTKPKAYLNAHAEEGTRQDLIDWLVKLDAENDALRGLFKKVQDHCAGPAHPRWSRDSATTISRCRLLDICNNALD